MGLAIDKNFAYFFAFFLSGRRRVRARSYFDFTRTRRVWFRKQVENTVEIDLTDRESKLYFLMEQQMHDVLKNAREAVFTQHRVSFTRTRLSIS